MPDITNSLAINFSNDLVRTSADRMAQSYNAAVAVLQRWVALGSNQTALDQMQDDIKNAANRIVDTFDGVYWTEKVWFSDRSSLFPNDSSPVIDGNGVPDPARPAITGADVNTLLTRCQQYQNWLLSATGSFTDGTRTSTSWLNTIIQVSRYGPRPIVLADAGTFINRCTELKTNYENNSNENLNTILRVAVNPNTT